MLWVCFTFNLGWLVSIPRHDFFIKSLELLKNVTIVDLDDAKSRPHQLSVGFRYVPSPAKPHELHR